MGTLTLTNPTLPPDQLEHTVSCSGTDGNCGRIQPEEEQMLRVLGTKLIQSSGPLLRIPQVTVATGQVLFQRFYYQRSFKIFSLLDICMASVFIACKVEETSRRLRDIVNVFDFLYRKYRKLDTDPLPYVSDEYFEYKDSLVEAESIVLRELGFHVHVQHAHGLLLNYLKALDLNEDLSFSQLALNYLNDMFMTDAFVRYQPNVIACACIWMAGKKDRQFLTNESTPWWIIFDTELEQMKVLAERLELVYTTEIDKKLPISHQELEDYYPLD